MKHLNLLFLSTAALLASCGGGSGSPAVAEPPPPAALAPQVTLTVSNGAGVTGNIVVTLTPTQTPVTVNNFLAYVASGFYVGTVFHRHERNFVLQGGGFAGPLVAGGATPTLKPTTAPIALEVGKGLSNVRYSVAMARTDVLNSATSQFFINIVDNVGLDTNGGGYAVFGNVTSGTDVITAMVAAPCSAWATFLGTACLPSPNITITAAVKTR
jgi:cyclophilin family peptidyl-prolyl cis-trans isomerase